MSIFDVLFRPFAREQDLRGRIYKLEVENQRLRKEGDKRSVEILNLKADLEEAKAIGERHRSEYIRQNVETERWKRAAQSHLDHSSALAARVANMETEGPKRALEKFNDAQAARAMSRNTKHHFRAYQAAVKVILDRLDQLGRKNHVTKEDLRKLRELRIDLGNQINREI